MTTTKKVIEYLNHRLLMTEKYQALFYWILLSITTICCIFVRGIALPIILILIGGITVYYVYVMIVNAKDKLLKINTKNNDLLKNSISDLSEIINCATHEVKDYIDVHNNELKENISRLMDMINDQTSQFTIQIENQTEIINAFSEATAKQKTKDIIDAIIKFEAENTKLSMSIQDSIIDGLKETKDLDANNLEKIISAGLSSQESISAVVDSSRNQIANAQADAKTELTKMLSMLADSVNLQSQQITQNTDSMKEVQNNGIIDIKEHAHILMQETKTSIFDTLDKQVDLLSNDIKSNSKMVKESILSFESNMQIQLFKSTDKIIETVELSDDQIKIAVCDNISSLKNDSLMLITEGISKIVENVELVSSKLKDTKEYVANRFEESLSKETKVILTATNESAVALNANLGDVNAKLSELTNDIETQKASISNELDIFTNEIIKCITTDLSNYSEKIIEGMASKIVSFSSLAIEQAKSAKLELSKVHNEINLLEQANKVSQKNNLDALNMQEQILGDIQAITSQLNNIRLLLNSVKSSDEVKRDRKGNVEVIEDKANNLKINNTYEGDVLKKSEMYSASKLKYYVEYDRQDKISYSKNYDLNGNILTENYYYPNEQVKERIEWTKQNGQLTKNATSFDENGNKKE